MVALELSQHHSGQVNNHNDSIVRVINVMLSRITAVWAVCGGMGGIGFAGGGLP